MEKKKYLHAASFKHNQETFQFPMRDNFDFITAYIWKLII